MEKQICYRCKKEMLGDDGFRYIPNPTNYDYEIMCHDCLNEVTKAFFDGTLGRVKCTDCGKGLATTEDTILLEKGNETQKNRYICQACMEKRKNIA